MDIDDVGCARLDHLLSGLVHPPLDYCILEVVTAAHGVVLFGRWDLVRLLQIEREWSLPWRQSDECCHLGRTDSFLAGLEPFLVALWTDDHRLVHVSVLRYWLNMTPCSPSAGGRSSTGAGTSGTVGATDTACALLLLLADAALALAAVAFSMAFFPCSSGCA